MKILISDSAFGDLESMFDYYRDQAVPEVGQNFVSAIFKHIQILEKHPDIGRMVPEFNEENIREVIHPPFRIVYLRESTTIQVIRVWRSERLLVLADEE